MNANDTTHSIHIFELEAAINYWRHIAPADTHGMVLSPQVNALSEPYAWLIVNHGKTISLDLLEPKAADAWNLYCQAMSQMQQRVA